MQLPVPLFLSHAISITQIVRFYPVHTRVSVDAALRENVRPFSDEHAESGLPCARGAYRPLPVWNISVRAAPIR